MRRRRSTSSCGTEHGWIEDRDLLVAILQFATRQPYSVVFRAAALYWSYARASPEALASLRFNNGRPDRPCLHDIELRDRASEHADGARPGSRAAAFWTSMVHVAGAEIERSTRLDRESHDD